MTLQQPQGRQMEDAVSSIQRRVLGEGLALVGFHSLLTAPKWLHVTTPDTALRSRSWEYLRQLVELCADLTEGGLLVFGSGKARSATGGSTRCRGHGTHGGGTRVARATRRGGRRHDRARAARDALFGHPEHAGRDGARGAEDCEPGRLDHDRLPPDGGPRDAAGRGGADLDAPRVHQARSRVRAGRHPGTGDFPFAALLASLRKASYGGWLSLEVFNFEAGGARIARETAEFIRKLEHDLDAP